MAKEPPAKDEKSAARDARLAEALRANLQRRKAALAKREAADEPPASAPHPATPGARRREP
jgi:hypothetical protein